MVAPDVILMIMSIVNEVILAPVQLCQSPLHTQSRICKPSARVNVLRGSLLQWLNSRLPLLSFRPRSDGTAEEVAAATQEDDHVSVSIMRLEL